MMSDNDLKPYKYENYEKFIVHLEDQERKTRGNFFDVIENEINEDEKTLNGHLEFSDKLSTEIEELLDKKYVYDISHRLLDVDSLNIRYKRLI